MRTYNHLFQTIDIFHEFVEALPLYGGNPILVRIHSTIHTKEQMDELAEDIREILPSSQIIGCSTVQVICEGKLYPEACLISITVFENSEIKTARIPCVGPEGQWRPGHVVAQELLRDVILGQEGFLLTFFPLTYGKIEDFVETVNESGAKVKMLGGAACFEDEEGINGADVAYVLEGTKTSSTELVVAFITAKELYSYVEYVCGVEAVGRKCPIVSKGCVIDKVDGVDGAEWYANLLGEESLRENPTLSNVFPVVKRDGKGIAYYVNYVEREDEGKRKFNLESYGELKCGSNISLGYFHPHRIFEQVDELLKNIACEPTETIFAYDCNSRMKLLHNCASWEIANFYTTDISGALLAGEISCDKGCNVYANFTFVIAALSEHEESRAIVRGRELRNISELQEDNVQMLNYLLMNANKHLNEELQEQQTKMQDAMFYNPAVGVDNQLKYLYDGEQLELDKLAMFSMENERMLKLFSGMTKTYGVLKDSYDKVKKYYLTKGFYLYSYEDSSLLVAGDKSVARVDFIDTIKKIQEFLNSVTCDDVCLSYSVAVVCEKKDAISKAEAVLRYGRSHKKNFVCEDEMYGGAKRNQEETHMVRVIKEALLHKRVMPYFQEIHNNKDDSKKMYESLMRIFDEDGKIYYPDEFLPVAKEYDLYESLSELMVETVINMFWDLDVRITINLNVQDIYDRKMIQIIFDNMQTTPRPENYVFEIVESEEITDYEYIREFADRIHQLGAKVAIDDFGSGFSNLLHVLQIEADYIKIDGEIIRTITEDHHCLEFIRLINNWCANNNQEVIAEYVENKEIQDIIDDIGVCHSQGYFFSKPHRWGEDGE